MDKLNSQIIAVHGGIGGGTPIKYTDTDIDNDTHTVPNVITEDPTLWWGASGTLAPAPISKPKCECSAHSVGITKHSDYCALRFVEE